MTDAARIEMTPNCSLSPRGARWFFGSVCAGMLAIVVPLTLMGYWPVLPFAGLELGLLWWALRGSLARGDHRQIITVTEDTIAIEYYEPPRFDRVVFPRHWAQVRIHGGGSPLQPIRLTVGSHGRRHEIGSFLNEQERLSLAGRLRRLIGQVNESPPLSLGGSV